MKVPNAVLQEKFYNLLMTMEKGTYPPFWISKNDLSKYMDRTVVYYDGNSAAAIGQVTKRVPCIVNGQ